MYWISSIQLLSGIMFARRTLQRLREKNLVDGRACLWTAMLVFFFLFAAEFFFLEHPLLQTTTILAICAGLHWIENFFHTRLKRLAQSEFPGFIDQIILAMKTGNGFRAAVERTLEPQSELWEKWLLAMLESHVFLRPNRQFCNDIDDPWWRDQLAEMQVLQQNPHHAIARLESLRRKHKVLSEFRRKSGQALLQARIQMVVMTVLYFALFVLTMRQFRIDEFRRLILLSVALFVAGQFLFWWIARKRSWKV